MIKSTSYIKIIWKQCMRTAAYSFILDVNEMNYSILMKVRNLTRVRTVQMITIWSVYALKANFTLKMYFNNKSFLIIP